MKGSDAAAFLNLVRRIEGLETQLKAARTEHDRLRNEIVQLHNRHPILFVPQRKLITEDDLRRLKIEVTSEIIALAQAVGYVKQAPEIKPERWVKLKRGLLG